MITFWGFFRKLFFFSIKLRALQNEFQKQWPFHKQCDTQVETNQKTSGWGRKMKESHKLNASGEGLTKANLSKILSFSAPTASQIRPFHLATMYSDDQSTIKNVPVACLHFSCIFWRFMTCGDVPCLYHTHRYEFLKIIALDYS